METITVSNYKAAVQNALRAGHRKLLFTLYSMPNSSATEKELALEMKYTNSNSASLQIGLAGKKLAGYLNLKLPLYQYDKKQQRDSNYLVIGPYSTIRGWQMHDNLKKALKELLEEKKEKL